MSDKNVLFQVEDEELENAVQEDEGVDSRKYLIFTVDDLKIGIDAEQVVEIMNAYSATYLPMMPSYIQGVFNMRGQIIPVVDIRLRLGKPEEKNFCGIVVDVDGNMVGILVDMVEQMVDVPLDAILPVPTSSGQAMVSGMCTLPDGHTMLELDCELLLHD